MGWIAALPVAARLLDLMVLRVEAVGHPISKPMGGVSLLTQVKAATSYRRDTVVKTPAWPPLSTVPHYTP